jgi:hypothetical protein
MQENHENSDRVEKNEWSVPNFGSESSTLCYRINRVILDFELYCGGKISMVRMFEYCISRYIYNLLKSIEKMNKPLIFYLIG